MKKLLTLLLTCCTLFAAQAQTISGFTATQSANIRALIKLSTDSARNESKAAVAALPKIDTGSFTVVKGVLYVNYSSVLAAVNTKADAKTVASLTTRLATAEQSIAAKANATDVNLNTTAIAALEKWQDDIEIAIAAAMALAGKIDTWLKTYSK